MKRILLILAIAMILPATAFAQLGAGPAAFFKSPVLLGQSFANDGVNLNQFSFGGALRYRLGLLQGQALGLYSVGDTDSLDIFLDAGVALDVTMVTLSFGAGPSFTKSFDGSSPIRTGLNARTGADVHIGPVSVGLSYIMSLYLDGGIDIDSSSGLLGTQVLFWL